MLQPKKPLPELPRHKLALLLLHIWRGRASTSPGHVRLSCPYYKPQSERRSQKDRALHLRCDTGYFGRVLGHRSGIAFGCLLGTTALHFCRFHNIVQTAATDYPTVLYSQFPQPQTLPGPSIPTLYFPWVLDYCARGGAGKQGISGCGTRMLIQFSRLAIQSRPKFFR